MLPSTLLLASSSASNPCAGLNGTVKVLLNIGLLEPTMKGTLFAATSTHPELKAQAATVLETHVASSFVSAVAGTLRTTGDASTPKYLVTRSSCLQATGVRAWIA